MTIALETLTITDASRKLSHGEFSARELTESYLSRIERENAGLNAYLEVFDDCAEQASRIDERRAKGEALGSLAGIPLAVKDNILIEGRRASSASKILEGYRAPYDATVIRKLKEAGAVLLGRTNMDEFAMGGSTENSAFGPTKNPHDTSRVPGGSSGGSAAAVAGNLALAALGSDTGGSIRQPAAFCGVVGLKPSYGRVSRSGLMAMASSLDQIGPFAKTVADAELLFEAIAGRDPMDSTTLDPAQIQKKNKRAKRIGVPRRFLEKGVNAKILARFEETLAALRGKGYEVCDIELPTITHSLAVYYIIMPAEVSTNLARFDGVRYGLHVDGDDLYGDYIKTRGAGFGREAKRRIILGTYVLSAGYYDAYYAQACKVRAVIRREFEESFRAVDAIAIPTTPSLAFAIGEKADDPLKMYLEDIFTVPANIAELPAISIPAGKTMPGLPVGFQLIAPYCGESALFSIGKDIDGD